MQFWPVLILSLLTKSEYKMARIEIYQPFAGGQIIWVKADRKAQSFDIKEDHFHLKFDKDGNDLEITDLDRRTIYFKTSDYNAAIEADSVGNINGTAYADRQTLIDLINSFSIGGGSGSGVDSFNGRTGAVTSQFGDYSGDKITYNAKVVISALSDFPAPVGNVITLEAKAYEIDGTIDLLGNSLNVSAGPEIFGVSQASSILVDSTAAHNMFVGGGTFQFKDLQIQSNGAGSEIISLTADTPFEAIEFRNIFFNGSAKIGTISGYRQFLARSIFVFGSTDGITFEGAWAGGVKISDYLVRGSTGTFFKGDPAVTFSTRFNSDANLDIPAGSVGCDFPVSAFLDGQYQIQGANFQGDGTYLLGAGPDEVVSNFRFNTGISNTFPGGEWTSVGEFATIISTADTYVDANVATGTSKLAHFDQPAGGQLRYLSTTPIRVIMTASASLKGTNNNQAGVAINHFINATTSNVLLTEIQATLNGGPGGTRAENVTIIGIADMNYLDILSVKLKNISNTNNITVANAAKFIATEVG